MKKDYPLLCNFCNIKETVEKRKIYAIEVSEVLIDDSDSKYPHIHGGSRYLQICEDCLSNNPIKEALVKENRMFE